MALSKSLDDVRVAHAIAIIKARRRAADTERELHWKKKAKNLKAELIALREELRDIEGDHIAISHATDLRGHLVVVVDFVLNLLGDPTPASDSKYFSTYLHQSVKFIEETMPHLLQDGQTQEVQLETSVKKLTSAISMNIMNFLPRKEIDLLENTDRRVWNQQIILKLGNVPYIGQQFLLTVSKIIAEIAETLVCIDPFHEGVEQTYNNLFFLLQLFEKLLSDHLCAWAKTSSFDEGEYTYVPILEACMLKRTARVFLVATAFVAAQTLIISILQTIFKRL